MDPRESARLISEPSNHYNAILPLAGVRLRDQSVCQTLRELIRTFFASWGLDRTLNELVYRSWSSTWPPPDGDVPFQDCVEPGCDGKVFWQPRYALTADCSKCRTRHYLTDYLELTSALGEDRPRSEVIHSFRAVSEALSLFTFILRYRHPAAKAILAKTLFLVDGPLLLRANLSRLVPSIRDLLEKQNALRAPIYLAGVEKEGEFRAYVSEIAEALPETGDYFALPVPFYVEQIAGNRFNPLTYINRVNYGAKVAARVGDFHTLAVNIPTGQFLREPQPSDLIGVDRILSTLSKVVSSKYENALIPLVLINEQASISVEPSARVLQDFVDGLLKGGQLV
jgi:hypothetical protein